MVEKQNNGKVVAQNQETGKVLIRGKKYQTVAYRVTKFRKLYPATQGWAIETECISCDKNTVIFKASIKKEDKVLATGHAEERRDSSWINRTSAFENAETSAIGRALAAMGLGGTEFASANEMVVAAVKQEMQKSPQKSPEKTAKTKTTKTTKSKKTAAQWCKELMANKQWIDQEVPFPKARGLSWKQLAKDEAVVIIKNQDGYEVPQDGSHYLKCLEVWKKGPLEIRIKAKIAREMFTEIAKKEDASLN